MQPSLLRAGTRPATPAAGLSVCCSPAQGQHRLCPPAPRRSGPFPEPRYFQATEVKLWEWVLFQWEMHLFLKRPSFLIIKFHYPWKKKNSCWFKISIYREWRTIVSTLPSAVALCQVSELFKVVLVTSSIPTSRSSHGVPLQPGKCQPAGTSKLLSAMLYNLLLPPKSGSCIVTSFQNWLSHVFIFPGFFR